MAVLSWDYILFVVVASAVFASVLMLISSRWFDIKGYRYQLDAQRYAIDLLNLIVSNSPLVEKIEDTPQKIVLSEEKLNRYSWNPYTWSNERKFWEKNFVLLEFDYNLTIEDLVNSKKWELSNLYFKDSECYYETMRISAFADVPVVISYGKEKHPGRASLILRRTPLSELAFFLSEAFMRSEIEDEDYLRGVRIDGKQIRNITVEEPSNAGELYKICLNYTDGKVCKYFYKGDKGLDTSDTKLSQIPEEGCFDVLVHYSSEEKKVILSL